MAAVEAADTTHIQYPRPLYTQNPQKFWRETLNNARQTCTDTCELQGRPTILSDYRLVNYLSTAYGQEAQEFWRRVLEGVDRPVARAMMANLDLRHCMGIPGSSTRGRKGKAPLLPFYEGVKQEHPTKVLLVRVCPLPSLILHPCRPLTCSIVRSFQAQGGASRVAACSAAAASPQLPHVLPSAVLLPALV